MSLVGQQIEIEMRPYRLASEIIPKLYAEAINDGNIIEYNKHGMRFKYASIKASDYPEINGFTSVLLYACSKPDKSHESGGMIIVFEDLIDAMFKEYGAVHEYGELRSNNSHTKGTNLEMETARKEGNLEAYLTWIKQNYPVRMKNLRRFKQS